MNAVSKNTSSLLTEISRVRKQTSDFCPQFHKTINLAAGARLSWAFEVMNMDLNSKTENLL